jgi:glycosyltransferase involved in cell wall biosynthesis
MLGITEVYPLIAGIGSMFISDDIKSRMIRFAMTKMYQFSMRKCPVVFFQNKDDERIFIKNKILKRQKRVLLHGSGVNLDKFQVLPYPEEIAFICISRLIRDKGVYEYLEACRMIKKKYPNIRCILVGPYDTNPSALKPEEIDPYINSKTIEFYGEQEDVRPFLEQASVFILPSYREGTPKTNLEAMACGRPVITTDAPGCRETVIQDDNGFLVPVKNVDAIYQKMKWFINHPDAVYSMGNRGRQLVEEKFDVNKVNNVICKSMQI